MKPLDLPMQRPIYTLIGHASYEQWVSANEEDLRKWFDLCGKATADGPATFEDSFEDFCRYQFDGQLLQEEDMPRSDFDVALGLDDDDDSDEDYDPYEAIGESPFGLPGGGKSL